MNYIPQPYNEISSTPYLDFLIRKARDISPTDTRQNTLSIAQSLIEIIQILQLEPHAFILSVLGTRKGRNIEQTFDIFEAFTDKINTMDEIASELGLTDEIISNILTVTIIDIAIALLQTENHYTIKEYLI